MRLKFKGEDGRTCTIYTHKVEIQIKEKLATRTTDDKWIISDIDIEIKPTIVCCKDCEHVIGKHDMRILQPYRCSINGKIHQGTYSCNKGEPREE